jgi:hypothetical protein
MESRMNRASPSVAAVLLLATLLSAGAARGEGPLATADQREVEEQAIALLSAPELVKARAEALDKLEAAPASASPDGRNAAKQAADELTYAAALAAVNGDPARPRVVWAFTAPRSWQGRQVPGSRWGIDNPDNVYRIIPVDGTSRYEVSVRTGQAGPLQFSFLVYSSFAGEEGKEKALDAPVAGLRDRDIQAGADGAFTITIGPEAAGGRKNHIQTTDEARYLLVRNTFDRWEQQAPFAVEVRRVGGPPPPPPPGRAAVAAKAAAFAGAIAQRLVEWTAGTSALLNVDAKSPNVVGKPFTRGGGWGFGSTGRWKVADGEALLVTLDPSGAAYLGFDLVDPWLVSREHIRAAGSLNNRQAVANADGTITYVIAAKDPGVANWADTGGSHQGQLFIRWQVLPEATKSIEGAVRQVKLVKLSEVAGRFPASARVTPAQRTAAHQARAKAYAHRYADAALAGGP